MQHTLRRAGGYAAVAAPALMWTAFFAAAMGRPDYNLFTRPFSDLATRGSANAVPFLIAFFVLPGLLGVLVGAGLWFAGSANPAWRTGAVLTAAAGLALFATGVLQQDPTLDAASILHRTVSQICFALASLAPVVLFLASSRDARLDPPRTVWLLSGISAAIMEVTAVILRPVLHFQDGIFQRPFTIALTVWFIATGAWLLRVRKAEGMALAE